MSIEVTNKPQEPTVPFEPQPFEVNKARFPKALAKVWPNVEQDPKADRPSRHREHVFDFEEGIRMMASLDEIDGEPILHLSFSAVEKPGLDLEKFKQRVLELCFIFAGNKEPMCEEPIMSECAVHFLYKP